MSSLVRRNLSLLLPRLARVHSVSPLTSRLHLVLTGQTAGVHSRVTNYNRAQANIRLQEDQQHFTGSPRLDKSTKLEEKLARFLAKLDREMKTNQRVLKHEVGNSIMIIEDLNSCTANQALLLIKCHGEVCIFVFLSPPLDPHPVLQAMVDTGREERTKLLASFVELIANAGVKLDISHYNCILQVCKTVQSH